MTPREYYEKSIENPDIQFCYLCGIKIEIKTYNAKAGRNYDDVYCLGHGCISNGGKDTLINFSFVHPQNDVWDNKKYYLILFHPECFRQLVGDNFDSEGL